MSFMPKHWPIKYRVFLASTLTDHPSLMNTITSYLMQAGLCYYVANQQDIKTAFEVEIEHSDIVVLLLGYNLVSHTATGSSLMTLIYNYAYVQGKQILAYCTDGTPLDSSSDELRGSLAEKCKCGAVIGSEEEIAANIVCDIMNLVSSGSDLTCWLRPDISKEDVDQTIQEFGNLNSGIVDTDELIRELAHGVGDRYNELVGPLIDAGLHRNRWGKAHRFVRGPAVSRELGRDELQYDYFINRFRRHKCFDEFNHGPIYDCMEDVSWFFIRKHSFSWEMLEEWYEHIPQEEMDILEYIEGSIENVKARWHIPSIDLLMTLLTPDLGNWVYVDEAYFPHDTHWFWSSTQTQSKDAAYYIETSHCQVLSDATHGGSNAHFKAVLLYRKGRPSGRWLEKFFRRPVNNDLDQVIQANQSQRLYGVYLSALSSTSACSQMMTDIGQALSRKGYCVSTYSISSARNIPTHDAISQEMICNDYYVLILDRPQDAKQQEWGRVKTEIQVARNYGLPIFLFHSLESTSLEQVRESLDLPRRITFDTLKFQPNQETQLHLIVPERLDQQTRFQAVGWIRKHSFEIINRVVTDINRTIRKVDAAQPAIEKFVNACDVRDLYSEFEKCGILVPPPKFGTRTWFVSKDTPLLRLSTSDDNSHRKVLPPIYIKYPNRFELIRGQESNAEVVYDTYLNLRWHTAVNKHTTYQEALAWAEEISEAEGDDWRLPDVKELITLITPQRGLRKYMDEKVFHTGRWFWTGTHDQEEVYYVDFNYMPDAVRLEPSVPEELFDKIRRKTALLVANGREPGEKKVDITKVFVSYSSEDAHFVGKVIRDLTSPSQVNPYTPTGKQPSHDTPAHQIDAWLFEERIELGEEWDEVVMRELEANDVLLLIWSKSAKKSREVHNEWDYYLRMHKPILILVLEEAEFPHRIARIQHMRYDPSKWEEQKRIIRQSIKRLKGRRT